MTWSCPRCSHPNLMEWTRCPKCGYVRGYRAPVVLFGIMRVK